MSKYVICPLKLIKPQMVVAESESVCSVNLFRTPNIVFILTIEVIQKSKIVSASQNPDAFGKFYNWKTGDQMDIKILLEDNKSILLSSKQAEKLGLNQDTTLPVSLDTEFTNLTIAVTINSTSDLPIITPVQELLAVELQIVGFFDSNRPGIGSQYSGAIFRLEHLQEWISLRDLGRETDIDSAFLVTYKTDHFVLEIDEDYLRTKVELLKKQFPKK